MYSKQQILHSIISDGQKMMRDGEVENKEEFQQKLHLLAEQWQSVVRRANQRKAIIESSIKQWQTFNDQGERLHDWLLEKEEGLEAFNVTSLSLQGIKNLLEKGKVGSVSLISTCLCHQLSHQSWFLGMVKIIGKKRRILPFSDLSFLGVEMEDSTNNLKNLSMTF